jgi:cell fate regulator YaaT (PSP1 superfamily)
MAQTQTTPDQDAVTNIEAVGIRFHPMGKVYHFDASKHPALRPGDYALVETARGQQLGEVVERRFLKEDEVGAPLKAVKRQATGRDMALHQEWRNKEHEVLQVAREAAIQMELPLKVVTAEYTFDGERITLLYTSEEKKLELGELAKRVRKAANARVDMRRIGVRDQAKLMGGYGACGEIRCCSRFLSDFSPVSIKMAKTQGISLNPSEITGMCGRLRCCLVYEDDIYTEACKRMPRRKKRVMTPHGEGRVVSLLPLKGIVVVQIEDRRFEVPIEDIEPVTTQQ